jgi:hypothetical protein
MVECLPSKYETLSSNPSSTEKKEGRKGGREGEREEGNQPEDGE